ncbi:MAG: hypothetical protein K9G62_02775 [Alphaproteobacteria bacterium]|nr:hypothetical protein [Alphaproteobacteria bacterium]
MHIFIDESGNFTGTNPSVVGALIIPDHGIDKLYADYNEMRPSLPLSKSGEVKGSSLDEQQISDIIKLLQKHDVIFEATLVEPCLQNDEALEIFKSKQAELIVAELTDAHHENAHKFAHKLKDDLNNLPVQLFAQSFAMFDLIQRVLEHGTLYWVQRTPSELGRFSWVLDAKGNPDQPAPWEEWWSKMLLPMLQSMSIRKPSKRLVGADYSHFEKFITDTPEYLTPHVKPSEKRQVCDLRKVMMENFRFSSTIEHGLELVDVLTNSLRRALIGKLKIEGWSNLPALMISRNRQYVQIIAIGNAPDVANTIPYKDTLLKFKKGGKSMLTAETRRKK